VLFFLGAEPLSRLDVEAGRLETKTTMAPSAAQGGARVVVVWKGGKGDEKETKRKHAIPSKTNHT